MKPAFAVILIVLGLTACSRREQPPAVADAGHHHHAPHGGVLVELGDHAASLEFKFDATRGILQAWVLDGHATVFVRVEQPAFEVQAKTGGTEHALRFVAVGNPLTGEAPGNTSAFEAEAAWLGAVKAFDGRVNEITVRNMVHRDIPFKFSTDESHVH
jgi:hypothetical protein